MFNTAFVKLLAGGAIVLAGLAVFAVQNSRPSESATRARFGDHTYEIPRAYGSISTSGIDTPKNDYAAFKFLLLMPNLAPRTSANGAQLDVVGWHDQVRGLIEAFPKNYERIADNATLLARFLGNPWLKGINPATTAEGYTVYVPHNKVASELRTKPRQNSDVLVFQCNQDGFVPYPSCTIYDHWEGLYMDISFSKKYAAQAEAIDQKVRAMFLSFRKN